MSWEHHGIIQVETESFWGKKKKERKPGQWAGKKGAAERGFWSSRGKAGGRECVLCLAWEDFVQEKGHLGLIAHSFSKYQAGWFLEEQGC